MCIIPGSEDHCITLLTTTHRNTPNYLLSGCITTDVIYIYIYIYIYIQSCVCACVCVCVCMFATPQCKRRLTTYICQLTSYQIRKIMGCACAANVGNVFPALRVSDPDMLHGTSVTLLVSCAIITVIKLWLYSIKNWHAPISSWVSLCWYVQIYEIKQVWLQTCLGTGGKKEENELLLIVGLQTFWILSISTSYTHTHEHSGRVRVFL